MYVQNKNNKGKIAPFLTLLIGIGVFPFTLTLPAIASPEGPWWERDDCICDPEGDPYIGHWHHCQDSEPTDFSCAEEDLGKATHCQDNDTNEQCSDVEPPGIPIET